MDRDGLMGCRALVATVAGRLNGQLLYVKMDGFCGLVGLAATEIILSACLSLFW